MPIIAPMSGGKPIVTRSTFDRKRIVVASEPTDKDSNGMRYNAKYRYLMEDGSEKLDYIMTVLPTLSCTYGCGQRIVNGWKNAGLPWSYELGKARAYFPAY